MVTYTVDARTVRHDSRGLSTLVRWHAMMLCSTLGWTRKHLILELGKHAELSGKVSEVLMDELHLKWVVRRKPHHWVGPLRCHHHDVEGWVQAKEQHHGQWGNSGHRQGRVHRVECGGHTRDPVGRRGVVATSA
jgi:hypothetical protein